MSDPLAFLDGIGLSEMVVIAFLSILVFGGRLPDVLRNLGRSYAKFRRGLHDLSQPIRDEIQQVTSLPEAPAPAAALPETAPPSPPGTYEVPAAPAAPASPAVPAAGPSPWPASAPSDEWDEPPPV